MPGVSGVSRGECLEPGVVVAVDRKCSQSAPPASQQLTSCCRRRRRCNNNIVTNVRTYVCMYVVCVRNCNCLCSVGVIKSAEENEHV